MAFLQHPDFAENVRKALNDLLGMYGNTSPNYDGTSYAVFDFDNTCSVFDIEEQTAIYQFETMSFALSPEELSKVLTSGIGELDLPRGAKGVCYRDCICDITAAYSHLYQCYGPFTPAGVSEETQTRMQQDPYWLEFAVKTIFMYGMIAEAESELAAYPWITYLFAGMTEQEVYGLAKRACLAYKDVDTSAEIRQTSPSVSSRLGSLHCQWIAGVSVPGSIRELMTVLNENGMPVWICSASMTDVIRAAIDVWGLHESLTGLIGLSLARDTNGRYLACCDPAGGYALLPQETGEWIHDDCLGCALTFGAGKSAAIDRILCRRYGHGPVAGFMDSTGDFHFCTEYRSMKLAVCFNRADRKPTDGGGFISALALYQQDELRYDLNAANASGDTLYLLQGRNENGQRTLYPDQASIRLGEQKKTLLSGAENNAQLQEMTDSGLTVREIVDQFAAKADLEGFRGYHSVD